MRKQTKRYFWIKFTFKLMSDKNCHFGKPENNFKLSVIKNYVRFEENK